MSSLFGNTANNNQGQGAGGGLFGSNANTGASQGGGLFGGSSNNQNPMQGTSLFGGNTNTQNQGTGGGLFGGNANTQNQGTGTSLFGGNRPSLFGGSTNQNPPQQQQQQGTGTSTSLFGGNQNQPNQQNSGSSSMFGSLQTSTAQNSSSMFGPPQPQDPPSNPNASLFPPPAPQLTYAERTFNNPQQTHLSSLLQSGLGSNPTAFSSLNATSQTDLARSRLAASGIYAGSEEKNTVEQIQTLVRKWDPNSQETLLQTYLYNAVNSAFAPFYYRNPDESERDWEKALANKPAPIVNNDGDNVSFVPVLVRGFKALSDRVEYQAKTLNELRSRLHEMNNSLNAIMSTHQQSITVRLENVRRQHTVLSQRCLRLAVKTQILRNRGYPLDGAEESLRRTLLSLSERTFDPQYSAREEEIWARMVALRDRARWLEEEGKRVAAEQAANAGGAGGSGVKGEEVSEEVIVKAKKILADYEGQIKHLEKELAEVRKEYEEWELHRR